jgi:hypothetical protein
MTLSAALVVVIVSEAVALWVAVRAWRSADPLLLKLGVTAVAIIPLIGPLVAIWVGNFPPSLPKALQDRHARQPDVYDRWRSVLAERNPVRKYRLWRNVMKNGDDNRP